MTKAKRLSKFSIAERKAWKFYEDWRKTGSKSPAFHGELILVTRLGWDHLLDSRKRRSKKEKIRRFQALPLAKKLLETATTVQEYREKDGISYWALMAIMDGRQIKVIVSARNKKKCFLSVIVLR